MNKLHLWFGSVAITSLMFSGCASSPMEKRLENNFVYSCSLQLIDKSDRKITGSDIEKICTAAHAAEFNEKGLKPEFKSDTKFEAKQESKPEAQPEKKPELKAESKSEVSQNAEDTKSKKSSEKTEEAREPASKSE